MCVWGGGGDHIGLSHRDHTIRAYTAVRTYYYVQTVSEMENLGHVDIYACCHPLRFFPPCLMNVAVGREKSAGV